METIVNVRVDAQLKADAEKALERMGLSMSSALRLFIAQVVREQRLPFPVQIEPVRLDAAQASERVNAIMALEGYELTPEMAAIQRDLAAGRTTLEAALASVLGSAKRRRKGKDGR